MHPSFASGSHMSKALHGQPMSEMSDEPRIHTSCNFQHPVIAPRPNPPSSSSSSGPSLAPSEESVYGSKECIALRHSHPPDRQEVALAYRKFPSTVECNQKHPSSMSSEKAAERTAKLIEQRKGSIRSIAPEDLETWVAIMHQVKAHYPMSQLAAQPDLLGVRLFTADPSTYLEAPILYAINKLNELSGIDAKPSQDLRQYRREIISISYSVLRRCMGDGFTKRLHWRPVYHMKLDRSPSREIVGRNTLPFAASQLPRVQVAPEIAVYLAPMKGANYDFDHNQWRSEVERVVATGADVRIHPPPYTFVIHDYHLSSYEEDYQQWQEIMEALGKVRKWMTQSWANWKAAARISTLYSDPQEWVESRERLVHDEEIFGLGYTIPEWMLTIYSGSETK